MFILLIRVLLRLMIQVHGVGNLLCVEALVVFTPQKRLPVPPRQKTWGHRTTIGNPSIGLLGLVRVC